MLKGSDIALGLLAFCVLAALVFAAHHYWRELRQTPRAFWLVTVFCVAGTAAAKATQLGLMLWLNRDCHLGDVQAGWVAAAYSLFCLLIGLKLGGFCAKVGLRKALLVACACLAVAGCLLSTATHPALILLAGFPPLALGFGMVNVISQVGIKTFVPTARAPAAFALFCVLYNLAVALGGWLFDQARVLFAARDGAGAIVNEAAGLQWFGHGFSTYQLIFLLTVPLALLGWLLSPGVPPVHTQTPAEDIGQAGHCGKRAMAVLAAALLSVVFVHALFMHCELTMPMYNLRVFGEGVKTGGLSCVLNCLLMVVLVPVVTLATRRLSSWTVLAAGTAVCACSFFIALIPAATWLPLHHTWLGDWLLVKWLGLAPDTGGLTLAHAPYWGMILMIFFLTLGETLWAPRLPQLCLELAPPGKEAVFLALGSLPIFAARLLVCTHSGLLLHHYTSAGAGAQHPERLWLWVGLLGLLAPAGLWLSWQLHRRPHPTTPATPATPANGATP